MQKNLSNLSQVYYGICLVFQGSKVRELKAAKSDKSLVDESVSLLLNLKKQLALATGEPAAAPPGGKNKKNKKKL